MNNREKGVGLIEVLVSMAVILLILGITYKSYNTLLGGFKEETKSVETQIEKLTSLELIRLDIEHAGYGIASDTNDKIIAFDNSTKTLTIRSTINNTDKSTRGYVLADCISNKWEDRREDQTNNNLVYISLGNKTFVSNGVYNTCPGTDVYLGFPYETNATGCSSQKCSKIEYALSNNQDLDKCNPYTRNLQRLVGGGTTPIVNCVADFQIRFELDTNDDGVIDNITTTAPTTNSDIRKQLKAVRVYLLVQEGQEDKKYNFTGNSTIDGINLQLPTDYQHYRWKVIKMIVKPLNL
ncbi:type IV pilus assembly protein PilW [Desulfonauticus submarinus]|uniref:Type IV pilus assembly protein PilW n=1 Tax=Desulfonauticus submarinus TaxID=206665 RepID=A0A1G9ZKW4_9BACT|nr:PilW family protein [Desulfonauticus submarinus]SDN21934.1 type IV pilus assembly protein PilW [Desulfonauticus submarinus]